MYRNRPIIMLGGVALSDAAMLTRMQSVPADNGEDERECHGGGSHEVAAQVVIERKRWKQFMVL